jgi:hypothetical protein
MPIKLPLTEEQKLTVISRIEPGCLGPEGISHVDDFCGFAQKELASLDSDFVHWELTPRHDKSLSETQYKLSHRRINHRQAKQYLKLFNESLNEFETHLYEELAELIDQFLSH